MIAQLTERAATARARIDLFGNLLRTMRGDRAEEEFLLHGDRVGPCPACTRGLAFEEGNRDWCERAAGVLRERERGRISRFGRAGRPGAAARPRSSCRAGCSGCPSGW
ncbi:hypothetical protein [Streptomyces atratus]|uniref:hypothetical protein n=1 Tax=Streptomyces atratus TaxID=1893 RepID=UPI003529A41F